MESDSIKANVGQIGQNVQTVKRLSLQKQALDYSPKLAQRYQHLRKLWIKSYGEASPQPFIGLNNREVGFPGKVVPGNGKGPMTVKCPLARLCGKTDGIEF